MPRVPKDVVAVTPGGNITMEQVLGWEILFSVPDQPVSLAKVLREFASRDLDTNLLPDKRVPVNVFQQACASVRTGRRVNDGREIVADQIYEDAHKCVYQITLKLRDRVPLEAGGTESIEFEKSMRVRFSKETSIIDVTPMDEDAYKALSSLESDIRDYFDQNAKLVPGGKIRAAVRGYMAKLGGTNLIPRSGCYFVPKGFKKGHEKEPLETAETLAEILTKLYGDKAIMMTIPWANSAGERDMIGNRFVAQMSDTITEKIGKTAEVLERDPKYIRKDLLRNTIKDRSELGELHNRYADLLQDALGDVKYKLDLYDQQIDKLVNKADALGTEVP